MTGGTGGIATDWAYHGITDAIHDLTPEEWGSGPRPQHVRTWRPPDSLRGLEAMHPALQARDLEADPARRAGDDDRLACEAQIHGSLR